MNNFDIDIDMMIQY